MRPIELSPEKRDEFINDATEGDCDNLLHTMQRWVMVE